MPEVQNKHVVASSPKHKSLRQLELSKWSNLEMRIISGNVKLTQRCPEACNE
jgi:hypothetical protein